MRGSEGARPLNLQPLEESIAATPPVLVANPTPNDRVDVDISNAFSALSMQSHCQDEDQVVSDDDDDDDERSDNGEIDEDDEDND